LLGCGAVEVVLPKKMEMTKEKNSPLGGKMNGNNLLNSLKKDLFSIIM
jgi:hypothetical protein